MGMVQELAKAILEIDKQGQLCPQTKQKLEEIAFEVVERDD